MKLLPEIAQRRAFRALSTEALEEGQVERLLSAAHCAPSCYNKQSWRMIAVQESEAIRAIKESMPPANAWTHKAPLIVVMATKPSLDCRLDRGRDYALFDLGLAAMSLVIQATHEGLYAHPIAGFNPAKIVELVGLPEDFVVITLIIIGKPGTDELLTPAQKELEASERNRVPLSEVAFRDAFGRGWK